MPCVLQMITQTQTYCGFLMCPIDREQNHMGKKGIIIWMLSSLPAKPALLYMFPSK